MMNGLVFAPGIEMPGDGTTAEFKSQAHMLVALKGGTVVTFDNSNHNLPVRGAQVLASLNATAAGSLDYVSFCCHGWLAGIQAGFDTRGGAKGVLPDDLAAAMARVAKPGQVLVVPLYCCSTAEDAVNGFAATLAAKLLAHGVKAIVFGHTTPGHCCRNPFVKVFGNGDWLVAPTDAHWHKWVVAMHDLSGNLDFRYPWMTRDQVIAELK